jgi:hypothetical protein
VSRDVQLKKVKPYPIPLSLDLNGNKQAAEILLLTAQGFIARINPGIVHVGTHAKCTFELPVYNRNVDAAVRVHKTYDRALEVPEKKVERLAEFHFEQPSREQTALIQQFMNRIGQK